MNTQIQFQRFLPLDTLTTQTPVLFIDSHAPLADLHAFVAERLSALHKLLTIFACCPLVAARYQRCIRGDPTARHERLSPLTHDANDVVGLQTAAIRSRASPLPRRGHGNGAAPLLN